MLMKVTDRRRLANIVQEELQVTAELRPFPQVVRRLLDLYQDPGATAADATRVLNEDTQFAYRVLQMCSSPAFGSHQTYPDIATAVAATNPRQLRHLVLAQAAATIFAPPPSASDPTRRLWEHSLGVATTARILAFTVPGVDADDAFLAGLYHDIGKLFFLDTVPDAYIDMMCRLIGSAWYEEERLTFEVTHEEIALKSAHHWELSEPLKAVVGFHHRPQEAPFHKSLVESIANADILAYNWGVGSAGDLLPNAAATCLERLSLGEREVNRLANLCRRNFNEYLGAFGWG